MKRVLIPTDFSKNAWNAIYYALEFFKNHAVTFIVVHIEQQDKLQNSINTNLNYDEKAALHTNSALVKLGTLKQRMLKTLKISHSNIILDHSKSNFIIGIREMVVKHDIDLIVMGTKGKSNGSHTIIGNHASGIITKVPTSVLVIPHLARFSIPFNIAFPIDYDFIYKEKILKILVSLVKIHQSHLKVLRVANSTVELTPFQIKSKNHLIDYLKNNILYSLHKVENKELEIGLEQYIEAMKIDVVAIIAKNLNFLQKILFKSKIAKMSYHARIPFLVLHE